MVYQVEDELSGTDSGGEVSDEDDEFELDTASSSPEPDSLGKRKNQRVERTNKKAKREAKPNSETTKEQCARWKQVLLTHILNVRLFPFHVLFFGDVLYFF